MVLQNSKTGGTSQQIIDTEVYPPSWIDRLTAWVAQLSGSSWKYYLGFGLALLFFQSSLSWLEGATPLGTFWPVHAFLSATIAFFMGLIYYLDQWAGKALVILRPDLTVSEEVYLELRYKLTTLPRGWTILASIIILGLNFLGEAVGGPYYLEALAPYPLSAISLRIIYLVCWWFFGAFLFHTIHQLNQINVIYSQHTRIHLFRTKPFYAFSNLSAFTAGSLVMIIYGWLLVNPTIPWNDPIVIVWILLFILTAVVTFLWPQLGMHRLQVQEQERLIDEAYRRLESTVVELHGQLDQGVLDQMEDLNFAIASLEIELNMLKRIRTWPWEPETLQILVTALALPLGLWIIQLIFERLLGG